MLAIYSCSFNLLDFFYLIKQINLLSLNPAIKTINLKLFSLSPTLLVFIQIKCVFQQKHFSVLNPH